jgi:hypothetical protein
MKEEQLKIKRVLDTTKATYDINGLTKEQFSMLMNAYIHYLNYICHCIPEGDKLYAKMREMSDSDILIL